MSTMEVRTKRSRSRPDLAAAAWRQAAWRGEGSAAADLRAKGKARRLGRRPERVMRPKWDRAAEKREQLARARTTASKTGGDGGEWRKRASAYGTARRCGEQAADTSWAARRAVRGSRRRRTRPWTCLSWKADLEE